MKRILNIAIAGALASMPLMADESQMLELGESVRRSWVSPDGSEGKPEERVYLGFDARIAAGNFASGAAEALRVVVNGVPVTVDRLRNKQHQWVHGQRSFVNWGGANETMKVLYHRWDDEAPGKGRLHRYVFDITSLLDEGKAEVELRSVFAGVEGAKVEVRNLEVTTGPKMEKHPAPVVEEPLYLSEPLMPFRERAISLHKGQRLKLDVAPDDLTAAVKVRAGGEVAEAGKAEVTLGEDGRVEVGMEALPLSVGLQVGLAGEGWKPMGAEWKVERQPDGSLVFSHAKVRVERRLERSAFGVSVVDRVVNLTQEDLAVGLLYEFHLGDLEGLREFRLFGRKRPTFYANSEPHREMGTIPTAWFRTERGAFGLLVDTDVLRNQASYLAYDETLGVGTDRFYLKPGGSQEVGWALSPDNGEGYYGFINRIRARWQAYQEIPGLFGFVYPAGIDRNLTSPEEIAAFLEDTGITNPCLPVAMKPEPGDKARRGRLIYGNEPAEEVQESLDLAAEFIRTAQAGGVKLPFLLYSDLHLVGVGKDRSILDRLKDSLIKDYRGNLVEYREGWLYNLLPTENTSAGRQFRETLERYFKTPGVRGVFLDEWDHSRARISFNHPDGVTALLDENFRIVRKVGTVPLMVADYQADTVDFLVKHKALIYANQFDTTRKATRLPVAHFAEPTQYDHFFLFGAQLGRTPLSLTVKRSSDPWLDVQEFLKYGVLTCFYAKRLTGDHLLKEVYPITVRQQGPGYVVGGDRIVTLRSGSYSLGGETPLEAHIFGGEKGQRLRSVRAEGTPGDRTVLELTLNRDNQEVAIIKAAAPTAQP